MQIATSGAVLPPVAAAGAGGAGRLASVRIRPISAVTVAAVPQPGVKHEDPLAVGPSGPKCRDRPRIRCGSRAAGVVDRVRVATSCHRRRERVEPRVQLAEEVQPRHRLGSDGLALAVQLELELGDRGLWRKTRPAHEQRGPATDFDLLRQREIETEMQLSARQRRVGRRSGAKQASGEQVTDSNPRRAQDPGAPRDGEFRARATLARRGAAVWNQSLRERPGRLGCLAGQQRRDAARLPRRGRGDVRDRGGRLRRRSHPRCCVRWAERSRRRVVAIDPSPQPELEQLERERSELELVRETSLDALRARPAAPTRSSSTATTTTTRSPRSCGGSPSAPPARTRSCRCCCCTTSAGPTRAATTTSTPSRSPSESPPAAGAGEAALSPGDPGRATRRPALPLASSAGGRPAQRRAHRVEDFVRGATGVRLVVVPAFFGLRRRVAPRRRLGGRAGADPRPVGSQPGA